MFSFAQATQPYIVPDIPPGWVAAIGAMATIITGIGIILGLVWNRQRTATQNIRSLGAATLANTKAINQSPGPSVPPEVEQVARDIRNDPTKAADVPSQTDPI